LHYLALTKNGELWAWGWHVPFQGLGFTQDIVEPKKLNLGIEVAQISLGLGIGRLFFVEVLYNLIQIHLQNQKNIIFH